LPWCWWFFAASPPAAAADPIAGNQAINPMYVNAGGTLSVTVDVAITGVVYGPVLDETVPENGL